MKQLYLGFLKKGYEIPEEVAKRYNIKVGNISPWTRLTVISEEEKNIDLKEVKKHTAGVDIKEIKNDVDIKVVKRENDIDIKEIKKL